MDNTITITRNTSLSVRKYISDLIEKSYTDIRGDIPDDITTTLASMDYTSSVISGTENRILGPLFRDDTMNEYLNDILLDLIVQYKDAYDLEEAIEVIRTALNQTIMSQLTQAIELDSRTRMYRELMDNVREFTTVYHNTFSINENYTRERSALKTNTDAGILKMGTIKSENYATVERSNVSLQILSAGGTELYRSNNDLLYTTDKLDPYYTNYMMKDTPDNSTILGSFGADQYTGLLYAVKLSFVGVYPITRISLLPFGFMQPDLVAIYYATERTVDDWNSNIINGNLTEVEVSTYASDYGMEVNIDRITAKDVYLIFHQKGYITNEDSVTFNNSADHNQLINNAKEYYAKSLNSGFVSNSDRNIQVEEIITEMKDYLGSKTTVFLPGHRSYVAGFCQLLISDCMYQQKGIYEDRTGITDGHLVTASVDFDGNLYRTATEGVLDTCTLFSLFTGGREFFLTKKGDDDLVSDAACIEMNMIYSGGTAYSIDPTYHFKGSTHFLIDITDMDNFNIFFDGRKLTKRSTSDDTTKDYFIEQSSDEFTEDSDILVTIEDHFSIIKLSADMCARLNITAGSIITLQYAVPSVDSSGDVYRVDTVPVEEWLGRPNIVSSYIENEKSYRIFSQDPWTGSDYQDWSHNDNHGTLYQYDPGDKVVCQGRYFRCITPHVSPEGTTQPGEGTEWRDFWIEVAPVTYRSYLENEYSLVSIGGVRYAELNTGKGETTTVYQDRTSDEEIVLVDTMVYAPLSKFSGPFPDSYWGVIDDNPYMLYTDTNAADPTDDPSYAENITLAQDIETIETDDYVVLGCHTEYVKGTLVVLINGVITSDVIEYDDDTGTTPTREKNEFRMLKSIYDAIGDPDTVAGDAAKVLQITMQYVPIWNNCNTGQETSTIAKHTTSESFQISANDTLTLGNYPHYDRRILNSAEWIAPGGPLRLKHNYSILYEPVVVYINEVKATDRSDYRMGVIPSFSNIPGDDTIEFYVKDRNTIVFSKGISGTVVVYYYKLSNNFIPRVHMYRSNYSRNDLTPELYGYSLYCNLQT